MQVYQEAAGFGSDWKLTAQFHFTSFAPTTYSPPAPVLLAHIQPQRVPILVPVKGVGRSVTE